jgi:hypothetical protein
VATNTARLHFAPALLACLQGCNTEAVRLLLGGNGLSDATMLAHLGIIEQRSNELLQVRGRLCLGVARDGCRSCRCTRTPPRTNLLAAR